MNITTTSYISEQILWGNTSIKDCLKNIMRHIWNALTANGIYYSLAFPISIIMLVIMTIWQIRKRSKDLYLYILAALVLLLTPFLMTILMGQMPKYRTQIVLPFVFGFIIQYFVGRTELFNSRKISQLLFLLGIGVLVLGIQQSMTAAQMFYSEYVQYEEDVRIATKITDRIDQLNLGERPSEPLIFIGSRSPQLNRSSSNSFENPGHSFFEWAFTTQYGTFIMENFLATIGYNYESPTLEQIAFAESYSKDMKIWPDTESVQVADGVIIVKLSDI